MRLKPLLFLGITCTLAASGLAQNDVTAEYADKVLIQRQFVCGPQPTYNAEGKVLSGDLGSWTTCAEISVQKVEANGNDLVIQGMRKLLLYDNENRQFRNVFDLVSSPKEARHLMVKLPKGKQLNQLLSKQPVTIHASREGGWNVDGIKEAMANIFAASNESPADVAPPEWKDFLCTDKEASKTAACEQPKQPTPAHRVGGPVSPPRVLVSPDPPYTDEARLAHCEGTTVLSLVVGSDGMAHDIRITRPIGLGLDESAVEEVKQWRFDPAKQGKQPVDVRINVEINFRLY